MSASQRRYARLKTRELADLVLPSGERLACEIRDFCQKGLNIRPTNPGPASTLISKLPPDTLVEVEFPIGRETPPAYKVKGKLIFRGPTDVGMYIEEMPPGVAKALTHARTKLPQREEIQDSLLPEESQAILRDCVNLFRLFLSKAWQDLHAAIKQRVAERDSSPLPLSDHSRFLNGLADLMLDIDSISRKHFDMLVNRMERIGEIHENEAPKSADELSIVDEGSFDDWLNITNVYNRIEADNRAAMFQFAQRFSRLTPIQIGPHNDPFGPQAVCLTFQEALHPINFSNEMRAILYRLFGDFIQPGYGGLYEQLNELLKALKPVSPSGGKTRYEHSFELDTGAPSGGTGGGSSIHLKSPDEVLRLAEIAERVFSLYPPLAAAAATQAVGVEATASGMQLKHMGSMPGAVVPAAGMAPPPQGGMPTGIATAVGAAQSIVSGMPATYIQGIPAGFGSVFLPPGTQIIGQPIAVLAAQAGATEDSAKLDAYMLPLRMALDSVVARATGVPQPAIPLELPPGTPDKVQGLLNQSGSQTPASPEAPLTEHYAHLLAKPELSTKLPPALREQLGALTQVLDRAIAEYDIKSDIAQLLKKVEKPIYDLVVQGGRPLRLDNHPLGRMINLIDRLAIVADDSGSFLDPDFRELANSIIDKGLAGAPVDPGQVTNSCNAVEKLLNHPIRIRKQRVGGYQEICEARGKIRNSHQSVAEELNQRLVGRTIPVVVNNLLEHGWQHLIVLSRLRGDEDEQAELWQALTDLLPATRMTTAKSTRLLNQIESRLQEVNTDEPQVNSLMKELASFLNVPEKSEQIQVTAAWFKSHDSLNEPPTRETEALAAKLKTGEWWDIVQGGRAIPMQLIWQSQPPGRVCFANRSAMRKLELSLHELASYYARNAAKPGENRDLPLLERAEYETIDSIYRGLVHQAGIDQMTTLPNRKALMHEATLYAKPGRESSFCVIRFDPFDLIFNTCGQQAGEKMARELAAMAGRKLGKNDRLAVCGDATFAIFMPNISAEAARVFASTLTHVFQGYRFKHEENSFSIHAFYGISSFRPETMQADEALRKAVAASDVAKSMGPNTIEIYSDINSPVLEQESLDKWAGQIDTMLASDRLFLRCQMITPLQDGGSPPYYEILLGVLDDAGRQMNPQPFVLATEHWNRAHELDMWVFGQATHWIRQHPEAFNKTSGFSINLSAQSLSNGHMLSTLHRVLSAGDLPCEKIVFEITETATLQSHAVAQDFIRQIRRYGCRFSLDDFGSGNASFGYLRNLRTDSLKIDGAYVKDMIEDPELEAMVRSMNDIGHALGMKTVAEYVATPELLALSQQIGIDYAQGFEVAKPAHIDSLIRQN